MKLLITRTDVGAGREVHIEFDRTTNTDRLVWATESAARYEAALRAIITAPDEAATIARDALDG